MEEKRCGTCKHYGFDNGLWICSTKREVCRGHDGEHILWERHPDEPDTIPPITGLDREALRHRLTAAALTGLLAGPSDTDVGTHEEIVAHLAKTAVRYADATIAMLAAREVRHD
jgi:hypothetical protein